MFIDHKIKPEQYKEAPKFGQNTVSASTTRVGTYITVGLAVLFMAALGAVFMIFVKTKPAKSPAKTPIASSSGISAGLPDDYGNGDDNGEGIDMTNSDIKAEYLTFGYFYKKEADDFRPNIKNYELPINVKVDVSNYYDISRKIDLDPYIDDINKYGFAIVNNQFSSEAKDFYSAYRLLSQKDIPLVITSDFLFYYYQNTLKEVFKEIEKTSFFDNIWNINKRIYNIALNRYKMKLSQVGMANDPVLEAMRLEMAYYAVALKLLMPTEKQVNQKPNLIDDSKFEKQDIENYNFVMPVTLEDDVFKEVDLIRGGIEVAKSPVMLYERDYAEFTVPRSYRENAKLNNFYLTLKWLNSNFPLYSRSESCPTCLLDHDDWLINLAAAGLITRDMWDNQDIKNQWAIIYKFISFFSGLRQDLTYLHYHEALTELFGPDYNIEEIFSPENSGREENLNKLQNRIAAFSFLDTEGGINRSEEQNRPRIGMRMLQESYWPNAYIFKSLTGKDISGYAPDKSRPQFTACNFGEKNSVYRCRGTGFDIINLVHPDSSLIQNAYFEVNTSPYAVYPDRINKLKEQLNKFDINAWNNNVYWSTLDLSKQLLTYGRDGYPVFMTNNAWHNQKDINTVIGGWINLHLPADKLLGYHEVQSSGLGSYAQDNQFDYIEPNIAFIQELIAKNNMLVDMMNTLKVTKKTNAASVDLKEINSRFKQILDIAKKELSDEAWDNDDRRFVSELAKQYIVENAGDKSITINHEGPNRTILGLDGINFVVLIYEQDNKKIMALGPVFKNIEKK